MTRVQLRAVIGELADWDSNPGLEAIVVTFEGRWMPFREMDERSDLVRLYEAVRETLGANLEKEPSLG